MTPNSSTMSDDLLLPGRIQARADILENNLFQSVAKGLGIAPSVEFTIDRSQWQNPIISKAIDQLLPRFNINNKAIPSRLGKLLSVTAGTDKTEFFETPVYGSGISASHFRKVLVTITAKRVDIQINGVPPIDGEDGTIVRYFFNHQDFPGKLLDNNTIDFREINKFPVIQQGEDMLIVDREVEGTPGLTFDGVDIGVMEVSPLNLKLGEGVERIDIYDSGGRPTGYAVRALRTGVVIFNKDALFPEIDVRDEIQVDKLDYSVGNIGTEYSCPISLKAGTVCNGFKVRVNGRVEADVLDGGSIRTTSDAVVKMVQADSRITAGNDLEVSSTLNSTIISETGRIKIKNELIDSLVSAPRVSFGTTRGLLSNALFETQDLFVNNVTICGENRVRLGHTLFFAREELFQEKKGLEQQKNEFRESERKLTIGLVDELKSIALRVNDDKDSHDKFKLLIQLMQSRSFESIHKVLDNLQKRINVRIIAQSRKLFDALQKTSEGIQALETRVGEIDREIAVIEEGLNGIQFSITGRLRPSATMVFYCGFTPRGVEPTPALVLDTDQPNDKRINVTGTYTLDDGFQFLHH